MIAPLVRLMRWEGARCVPARGRQGSAAGVAGQSQTGELPAIRPVEEIAVGRTDMPGRRSARSAAQYQLIHHELPVVFAERTGQAHSAGIRRIGRLRPYPYIAVPL